MVFSTMTTAPSMISPKSTAPRLIRLPDTRPCTMPVMANRKESGMARETMIAARTLPSSKRSTTMTSTAPSTRFFSTVAMVRSTNSVRS